MNEDLRRKLQLQLEKLEWVVDSNLEELGESLGTLAAATTLYNHRLPENHLRHMLLDASIAITTIYTTASAQNLAGHIKASAVSANLATALLIILELSARPDITVWTDVFAILRNRITQELNNANANL